MMGRWRASGRRPAGRRARRVGGRGGELPVRVQPVGTGGNSRAGVLELGEYLEFPKSAELGERGEECAADGAAELWSGGDDSVRGDGAFGGELLHFAKAVWIFVQYGLGCLLESAIQREGVGWVDWIIMSIRID